MSRQTVHGVVGTVAMIILIALTCAQLQQSPMIRLREAVAELKAYQAELRRGTPIPRRLWDALDHADRYELLSLDPDVSDTDEPPLFHHFHILGRTDVTDADRRRLNNALDAGVRGNSGAVAACFQPRHGIRVTTGETTTDFVICFHCLHISVYRDDERLEGMLTTESPEPTFDAILQQHNVALSPKSR